MKRKHNNLIIDNQQILSKNIIIDVRMMSWKMAEQKAQEISILIEAAIKLEKTHKINIFGCMKYVGKICIYAKNLRVPRALMKRRGKPFSFTKKVLQYSCLVIYYLPAWQQTWKKWPESLVAPCWCQEVKYLLYSQTVRIVILTHLEAPFRWMQLFRLLSIKSFEDIYYLQLPGARDSRSDSQQTDKKPEREQAKEEDT